MSRRPQQLAAVLGRVQESLAPPDLLAAVQRHWREAAGEQIAEEAWPDAERDGRVTIRCRSAVWAAELTMLESALLEQLNERLPRERQARSLKFTTASSGARFRKRTG
jgi:predicted nucleic acid-binding Zn ribbon protein